jgi:hypothetical protein
MAAESALDKAQARLTHQLNIVEEIRGDLNEQGIDLPGVVVCGDQSAGESRLSFIEPGNKEAVCASFNNWPTLLCLPLVNFIKTPGKSSVLESLTGIEFPRAENTCTRCPAIVRLQADPTCQEPYALIGTSPTLELGPEKATKVPLDKIGDEIARLTESLCQTEGSRILISSAPIHIKVIKPSGPTFTLIDLPGGWSIVQL